ncbi:hypothetical protein [Amycolatopsis benzoatilytica]|uniref:hypothetical protein n=1 Tax=Amycolatopsis benzoatilytica TaxID=346045 RepID=UPI00036E92D9|nr:hypothetical protein [Amycolatopsis benzoatilytica]
MFRPDVAEAPAVWCTTNHDTFPDEHPLVYFDGGTLVHVHQHLRSLDGYRPWRIDPDPDGNYRIDGHEWTFHAASETSEGEANPAAATPQPGQRAQRGRSPA